MQNSKCKITIQNSKIIEDREINHRYGKIIIKAQEIAQCAKPGQFINMRINNTYEPLLRRPFSIHRVRGANLEIVYEVVGRGTRILSQKKSGECLDMIGPLGNGFSILDSRLSILVAGGIGVAPLVFLAEKLKKPRTQNLKPNTLVLIGAGTKKEILCEKEFKKLGCTVLISTDDGSKGFKGKVTDLLEKILLDNQITRQPLDFAQGRPDNQLYACGPRPMLKEISNISKKYRIPAQISLEEHMVCGIGACLGCAVKSLPDGQAGKIPASAAGRQNPCLTDRQAKSKNKFEYKRVCKEGPVFNAKEIIW